MGFPNTESKLFLRLTIFVGSFLAILIMTINIRSPIFRKLRPEEEEKTAQESTPKSPRKQILILYWSTFFRAKMQFVKRKNKSLPIMFHNLLEEGSCPVSCQVTSDRSRANEASAFIVHARDPYPLPPTKAVPWILHTEENPVYTPVMRNVHYMSKFKMLMSYRLTSDFPKPNHPMPSLTPPVPFKEKNGTIIATFSHCERVRTQYMKTLMEYIQVDSYGRCVQTKTNLVRRYGRDFKKKKTELTRNYKFSLVFMNQDCEYFVDDRLYHALTAGSVPVYMGTDKVDEFLPGNLKTAIIKVRDFQTPKLLADYLTYLSHNETAYNKYLEWKFKGFGDIQGTVVESLWHRKHPFFCDVCMKVVSKQDWAKEKALKPINCAARRAADWGL